MSTVHSRAGLMLGAIGMLFAFSARADDLRPVQSLIESGLFLSQAEADAVYARLDAPRKKPAPGSTAYWESGAVSLGQSDRGGRLGWSGDSTPMRLGADTELRDGLIVGGSVAAAIGGVSSADLSARTVAQHADGYVRLDGGALFVKGLLGASSVRFQDVLRGSNHSSASGYAARTGAQFGGMVEICGVKVTPTAALTATGASLRGRQESGPSAAVFGAQQAAAATATVRLTGERKVRLDPNHAVHVSGFVGADEVVAFRATSLKASLTGAGAASPRSRTARPPAAACSAASASRRRWRRASRSSSTTTTAAATASRPEPAARGSGWRSEVSRLAIQRRIVDPLSVFVR